jgi:cation diffusion facilitator family transporter
MFRMRRWLKHVPRAEARAAGLSLGVGLTLLAIKFGAYLLTGSAAVFADALEGIVNVAAAGFAAYALATAHRPADVEHPYGHGKIEFMSAAFEGGMILLAAAVALLKALSNLVRGPSLHPSQLTAGLLLMSVALMGNAFAGLYLIRVGRSESSLTLEADGRHLLTDAVTSAAALAALLAVRFTGAIWLDPAAGALVSVYIAWAGLQLMRRAAAGLMDEQDVADADTLRRILDSHVDPAGPPPRICSYHKLRHRHAGRYHWVDFHIMVPGHWPVARGHQVASAIEHEIELALLEGNATAHIEPCVRPGCPACDSSGRPAMDPLQTLAPATASSAEQTP